MKHTIIIGDLHGCYYEALELLDKVGPGSGDRIIFTGELLDRGPYSRECVELAMGYESSLGNHENKHLRQCHSPDHHLTPDHLKTRAGLGEER